MASLRTLPNYNVKHDFGASSANASVLELELPPLPGSTPPPLLFEHINLSIPRLPRPIHSAKTFFMRGLRCRRNWAPQRILGRTVEWGFWLDLGLQQIHVPTIPLKWHSELQDESEPAAIPTAQIFDGTVLLGVLSLDLLIEDLEAIQDELEATKFDFVDERADFRRVLITCPFGNRFTAVISPVPTVSAETSKMLKANPTVKHWLNAQPGMPGLPCSFDPPPTDQELLDSAYEPDRPNCVSIIGTEMPCLPSTLPLLNDYWSSLAPCELSAGGRKLTVRIGTDQRLVFYADPSHEGAPPRHRNNPHLCIYLTDSAFEAAFERFRDQNNLYHSNKRYRDEALPVCKEEVQRTGQFRIRDVKDAHGNTVFELEIEVRRPQHRVSPFYEAQLQVVETAIEQAGGASDSPVSV